MAEENNNNKNDEKPDDNNENDALEEDNEALTLPDIGLGKTNSNAEPNVRGESNPFSFKHFLSCGNSARPKMYQQEVLTIAPSPPPSPKAISSVFGAHPELTSSLPDFVQDHLVVEQCFGGGNVNNVGCQEVVDLNNLVNFQPHDNVYDDAEMPYHQLMNNPQPDQQLDLIEQMERHHHHPLHHLHRSPSGNSTSGQVPNEVVGPSKSLPDFLSDGPIRRQREDNSPGAGPINETIQADNERRRLRLENERIRQELNATRRQLNDQLVRSETLEAELNLLKNKKHSDKESLLKIMEQLEDDVKRATKRAVTAESRADKLKQDVNSLRHELDAMRCRDSTASTSAQQSDNERLASQLRNAANTAELSLRHLLIGVDNLRLLAASLESNPTTSSRHHTFDPNMPSHTSSSSTIHGHNPTHNFRGSRYEVSLQNFVSSDSEDDDMADNEGASSGGPAL